MLRNIINENLSKEKAYQLIDQLAEENEHIYFGGKEEAIKLLTSHYDYELNPTIYPRNLYRFLFLDSENQIDKNNLGIYWTPEKNQHTDYDFIESVSISGGDVSRLGSKIFRLTAQVGYSDINLEGTLNQYVLNPNEIEITLLKSGSPKLLKIEEIQSEYWNK